MVWSIQGLPFYVTPERYRELRDLPITFQYDTGEMIPTVPWSELGRRQERLEAMRDRDRCAHSTALRQAGRPLPDPRPDRHPAARPRRAQVASR
jgi:hypothetical protein